MLWVIVMIHVVFWVLFHKGYSRTKNMLYMLSGLITFGLFYDALILALGGVLSAGPVLMTLSRVRFVSHSGLIPLIF